MTTLEVYTDILIVIALFVFIVNQLSIFYDRVHIDLVTRKTRKMLGDKQHTVSEPFHLPKLDWRIIATIVVGLPVVLLISVAGYIAFIYIP